MRGPLLEVQELSRRFGGLMAVNRVSLAVQGGEIFVPKIPSVRVVDLASAMAPALRMRT